MKTALALVILAIVSFSPAWAGPQILNYQGSLIGPAGASVPDGTYRMRFRLYAAQSGGSNLWSETDTAVEVRDGLFSTILGDGTAFGKVFDNNTLYLEIAVDTSKNSAFDANEIFAPRQRMTSAAWAINSDKLGGRAASNYQPRGYDAVVAQSGGDYTTIRAALVAGRESIFVRNGTYVLSDSIEISNDGTRIVGESRDGVVLDCNDTTACIEAVSGAASYIAGTIAVSNGSSGVNGSGTSWTGNVSAGAFIRINGSWYRIATVASNTVIALEKTYHGPDVSGAAYQIVSMIDGIEIENLTLRNSAASNAVYLKYAMNGTIRGCAVTDCDNAIAVEYSSDCRIQDNECNDNTKGMNLHSSTKAIVTGNQCNRNTASGIYTQNASGVTLSDNTCSANGDAGIYYYGGHDATLTGNVFQGNRTQGILVNGADRVAITGNTSCDNGDRGIVLSQSDQCTASANIAYNNASSGILVFGCARCSVSGNASTGNARDGITVGDVTPGATTESSIVGNTCTGNSEYGIRVSNTGSDNNIVGMNILTGNTSGALSVVAGATTLQTTTNYPAP
jgi:parallel beta-helix repeat protein